MKKEDKYDLLKEKHESKKALNADLEKAVLEKEALAKSYKEKTLEIEQIWKTIKGIEKEQDELL